MTTLSSFLPSNSAITLARGLFTTATVAVEPWPVSNSPAAKLVPTTGTVIVVEAEPAAARPDSRRLVRLVSCRRCPG